MTGIRFHPEATDEAEGAVRWYNERVAGLGEDFRLELLAAVERIFDAPLRWPASAYDQRARRYLMPRFPYGGARRSAALRPITPSPTSEWIRLADLRWLCLADLDWSRSADPTRIS